MKLKIYNEKEEQEESVYLKLFKKDGVVTLGCADLHGKKLDREDLLSITPSNQCYVIRLCELSNKQCYIGKP